MTPTLLHRYQNGNITVSLYADGTKIRYCPDAEERPAFAESIDLKITGYCDMDGYCTWCHEGSNRHGVHADSDWLHYFVGTIPRGTELAIGGGNPMAYPRLMDLLELAQTQGLVANLTVNALHLRSWDVVDRLETFRTRRKIHGLGITWNPLRKQHIAELNFPHKVVHMIAGVHSVDDVALAVEMGLDRILILGYKAHNPDYQPRDLDAWREAVPSFSDLPAIISFDNLAVEQLDVRLTVNEATWNQHFLGPDGTSSMYVDAVTRTYARTSFGNPRHPIGALTAEDCFQEVQAERHGHDRATLRNTDDRGARTPVPTGQ